MTAALSNLRELEAKMETNTRAKEFVKLAMVMMQTQGAGTWARSTAESQRAPDRVRRILNKAEPGAIGGASPQWGAELSDFQSVAQGFIASLRHVGTFDAMLPAMIRVPLRARIVVTASAIVGDGVAEQAPKPVSEMVFASDTLEPRKAAAVVVVTEDLLRLGGTIAERLIGDELRNATVAATDSVFLADLIAGTTPIASAGSSAEAVLNDLGALLAAIQISSTSRLFFVVRPEAAAALAIKYAVSGVAFPQMTVNGGNIGGVSVLVSDQLADGEALLADASQIAAASEAVRLDASAQAALAMNDESPQTLTSLWQKNLRGVRAERWFGFRPVRATAIASLSGVDYGLSSP